MCLINKIWLLCFALLPFCSLHGSYTYPLAPQIEIEELTIISVKYGNNPKGAPALIYAILQNDEHAVELLLKYGASPFTTYQGEGCIYYSIIADSIPLLRKFIDLGLSLEKVSERTHDAMWVAQRFRKKDIIQFLESR